MTIGNRAQLRPSGRRPNELRPVTMTLDFDKDGQVTSRDATAILQKRRDQLATGAA
mgnify:CR=1 FL=1